MKEMVQKLFMGRFNHQLKILKLRKISYKLGSIEMTLDRFQVNLDNLSKEN